jgi:hypothetical protein
MAKVELVCHCGQHYFAREADIKRGWGLSCSKSCAAIRRDYGRPTAQRVDGLKIPRVRKKDRGANRITSDTRQYLNGIDIRKFSQSEIKFIEQERIHEQACSDMEFGWDGHKNSF